MDIRRIGDHMMGVERESERSLAGNWVSHGRPDCHHEDHHHDEDEGEVLGRVVYQAARRQERR